MYNKVKEELKQHKRRWLVTGCAGFIGSHIVEELLRLEQEVVGLDNLSTGCLTNLLLVKESVGDKYNNFQLIKGDITDFETCRNVVRDINYVLHQAALGSVSRSIKDPMSSHKSNVDGFIKMFIASRDQGVKKFVYASSSSVYGTSEHLPKKEDNIGKPLSPYAATKLVNEVYACTLAEIYGIHAVGLRYFNVFGPRQDPSGSYSAVIPRWINEIKKNKNCLLFGDGTTSRDFCYVANVVQANILAACINENSSHNIYNIAVGEQTSLLELYQYISRAIKEKMNLPYVPEIKLDEFRAGDVKHSLADISKAKNILGYNPYYNLQQGLSITIDWFLSN